MVREGASEARRAEEGYSPSNAQTRSWFDWPHGDAGLRGGTEFADLTAFAAFGYAAKHGRGESERRIGLALAAAALQFSVRDARVSSTIVGFSRPERVAETVGLVEMPIPNPLWPELDAIYRSGLTAGA